MFGIYDSFGFLFSKVSWQLSLLIQPVFDDLNINNKQAGIILIVGDQEGITQKEVGLIQQIDRTTMTKLTDELEQKNMVERRVNPKDRRAYGLYLTENGRAVLQILEISIKSAQNEYFAGITQEEVLALKTTLERLIKRGVEHE